MAENNSSVQVLKKERILGLDIIRTIAILGVFITHFIAYRGVLKVEPLSFKWTIYMIIRFLAMTCVPLFLILTGYLNSKKEVSKKYYKGIIPLLFSYITISILEIILTSIYNHTPINISQAIISILNFTANSYAWYFEMYIGLFLLIPFLNILYDNLKSKKEKITLLVSLAFLTFIPQIVKSFKVDGQFLDAVPDYWQIIYPITYFYLGKMIKDFKPNLKVINRVLLFIGALAIPCTFCYVFSVPEKTYAWFTFNGFEALTNAFTATAIFLMFYDIKKCNVVVDKIFAEISICSFEMYLVSSIVDKYLYSKYSYNIIIMVSLVLVITYVFSRIFIFLRNLLFGKVFEK